MSYINFDLFKKIVFIFLISSLSSCADVLIAHHHKENIYFKSPVSIKDICFYYPIASFSIYDMDANPDLPDPLKNLHNARGWDADHVFLLKLRIKI